MSTHRFHRTAYPIRRFLHHALVDLRVRLRNREAADAFHDPILEGPGLFGRLLDSWRGLVRSLPALRISAPRAPSSLARLSPARAAGFLRGLPRPWPIPDAARIPLAAATALSMMVIAALLLRAPLEAPGDTLDGIPAAPAVHRAPATPAGPAGPEQASPSLAAGDSVARGAESAAAERPDPAPAQLPDRYHALVASKRDRTLYVYERRPGGQWSKEAAFPMAFGRRSGDKDRADDRRTPEGRYWITSVLSGPSQGPLYGALVFTLNYPTARDVADGKDGDGIWIHGVEAGRRPTYTRGCLALDNEDVVALEKYADAGTPVLILADTLGVDPARQFDEIGMRREYPSLMAAHGPRSRADSAARERAVAEARAFLAREAKEFPGLADGGLSEEDRAAVLGRLEKWRIDWTRRDLAAYAANYSPDFRDLRGKSLETFLARKRRIFESKTSISMRMEKPEVALDGYGMVTVTFRQEYSAEGGGDGISRSSGAKTVWLEQGPEGWLIVKE
jgi:murein L,D-transpeptidase YafK